MLTRYQRPGGFVQLVQLIETCGPQKQQKLLENVESENTDWALALESKILTLERILLWDATVLAEIVPRLQDLTLAIAFKGLPPETFEKCTGTFTHGHKKRILGLMSEKTPSKAEISTAFVKIIEEVRYMINQGDLNIKMIDEKLYILPDIEDSLDSDQKLKRPVETVPNEMSVSTGELNSLQSPDNKRNVEKVVQKLKLLNTEVLKLQNENIKLKEEVSVLKQRINKAKSLLAA